MSIRIQRHNGLYTADVTPPHGRETHWRTPEPLPANELVKELLDPGCHTTDIGDAFFAAYPDWIDDTNA